MVGSDLDDVPKTLEFLSAQRGVDDEVRQLAVLDVCAVLIDSPSEKSGNPTTERLVDRGLVLPERTLPGSEEGFQHLTGSVHFGIRLQFARVLQEVLIGEGVVPERLP